ncbi:hypothetical protein T458_08575 [Brevibacillus panacihumi W25]|uniref:Uncharacterized protein n=1 Tax=Brevibacillus panacihumi W25 TaxID=1408254 RepID=V6M9D9_9BACL|nr:hypothetical protein T458_08575 [Brevibacillus panacihumi W25]
MNDQRVLQDLTDRLAWIQRGERVLKDQLHVAARLAQLGLVQIADIFPLEPDLTVRWLDQAEDAAAGRRLAAAGFANNTDGFARIDGQVDPVDCPDYFFFVEKSLLAREMLGQCLHFQQWLGHCASSSPYSQQRHFCVSEMVNNSGFLFRQISIASGQRGAKRHPAGISCSSGTAPGIASNLS